jgi:Zn-dependent oligopeptidase
VNRYTYSLVFAADMYSAVFKSDPLDPGRGARYRRSILEPGGSREELDSLKVRRKRNRCQWIDKLMVIVQEFLGRPPNPDAFMEEIFGKS